MLVRPKGFDYWTYDDSQMKYVIDKNAPQWAKDEYNDFYKKINNKDGIYY
ncbi:hypothetical protein [Fructilactobacillus frigidiflavus]